MLDAKHDGVLSTTGVLDVESDGVGVMNAVVDIGKARILDDVSVSAPKGSCLVILGPSGCGKTTLLELSQVYNPYLMARFFFAARKSLEVKLKFRPNNETLVWFFRIGPCFLT